jgi:hypothetical protein
MNAGTKFVVGLVLTVFVIALFAMKPGNAGDGLSVLDTSVRVLSLVTGAWVASNMMHPLLLGRR